MTPILFWRNAKWGRDSPLLWIVRNHDCKMLTRPPVKVHTPIKQHSPAQPCCWQCSRDTWTAAECTADVATSQLAAWYDRGAFAEAEGTGRCFGICGDKENKHDDSDILIFLQEEIKAKTYWARQVQFGLLTRYRDQTTTKLNGLDTLLNEAFLDINQLANKILTCKQVCEQLWFCI